MNPLPQSLEVELRPGARNQEVVERISPKAAAYPFVEDVRYGREWVDKLFTLRRVGAVTTAVLGGAFFLVAALIIGTALRIAIFARARRDLHHAAGGAKNGFIRRPFLLEGAMAGLLGGLLAWVFTYATYRRVYAYLFAVAWIPPELDRPGARRRRWSSARWPAGWPSAGTCGRCEVPPARRAAARRVARARGPRGRAGPRVGARPAGAAQQTDIRKEILESQRRLEQIRAERARLQKEMEGVQVRVRDALRRAGQRRAAALGVPLGAGRDEFQADATSEQIEATTEELLQTRERLAEGKAVLDRRLRDIYKMGPLHTVRVLLGATSFTDLLNRYRYLQRVATFDRTLVDRVARAGARRWSGQSEELRQRMAELGGLRQARLGEVAQLRAVEPERQATLGEFRSPASAREDARWSSSRRTRSG